MFSPQTVIGGIGTSDIFSMHYPFRYYLHSELLKGEFPFWSEKVHSGFPVYADSEKAYLSLINVVSILIFGPMLSLKVLHFLFYIFGSYSLYLLLEKKNTKTIFAWYIANFIFYFSFFHIFRQQLFNTIVVTYLIPPALLSIKKFLQSQNVKYLVLNVVINAVCIHFGQFNFVFISMLTQLLFYLSAQNKTNVRTKDAILYLLLSLTLNIYMIVPTAELAMTSERSQSNAVSQTEGSYTPFTFLLNAYPYSFNTSNDYIGKKIDEEYYINEFYVYFGISTIFLTFIAILIMGKSENFTFFIYCLSIFLMLGFMKYLPILSQYNIPILNLFRYWMRTSIIFITGLSVFLGTFLQNQKFEKTLPRNLLKIVIPSGVFFILYLLNGGDETSQIAWKHISNGGIVRDTNFQVFVVVTLASISLVLIAIFLKNYRKIAIHTLAALIILDLGFYSLGLSQQIFEPIEKTLVTQNIQAPKNQRVIYIDDKSIYGNRTLQLDSWSIYGYSGPFESQLFNEFLKSKGFPSQRRAKFDLNFNELENNSKILSAMKQTGVVGVVDEENRYHQIQNINDLFYSGNYETIIKLREEGRVKAEIKSTEKQEIKTLLRNYYGWNLTIDGQEAKFSNTKDDVYLSFFVPEGNHVIEIVYVPKLFYIGVASSALFGILTFIFYKKNYYKFS